MKIIVPKEIENILIKKRDKKELTDQEQEKLYTYLCGLESAVVNPALTSTILVNPLPKDPDVSLEGEKSLEDRIRHINTVSAKVRAQMRPETEEELEDFEVDDSFNLLPKSIFEVADHESAPFIEETLHSPSERIEPNPDLESEADVIPPEDNPSPGAEN